MCSNGGHKWAGRARLRRAASRPPMLPAGYRRGGCVRRACTNRARACAAESGAAWLAFWRRRWIRRPRTQTINHKPSLRPSCLGARWRARRPAQERSTKALGLCQHHGERDHAGRGPGPSWRSPQASSSSSNRSCRSSHSAGQRSRRAVLREREGLQFAQQVTRPAVERARSTQMGYPSTSTRRGLTNFYSR